MSPGIVSNVWPSRIQSIVIKTLRASQHHAGLALQRQPQRQATVTL
jgi:hypothetical protein